MTKSEFLDELCRGLRFHTDPDEIQHIISYYDQAIDDRVEDGMTEEEAVAAMGDPQYIINEANAAWERERSQTSRASTGQTDNRRTFPSGSVEALELYDSSGDVRLLPSPDEDIHVEYNPSPDWRYDVDLSGSTLTVRRTRNRDVGDRMDFDLFGFKFSVPKPGFGGIFANELRLTVLIPPQSALSASVNVASGDVRVSSLRLASLYVKSASGDIDVSDLTSDGKVSLVTASGDTDLGSLTAPEISVSTVSGDVDARDISCSQLEVRTVSGDMDLGNINPAHRASLYTVSGDTTARFSIPCPDMSAESVSGDIDLTLPGSAGLYTVTTRTRSGDIHTPENAFSGPNQVRVKTLSGDITVSSGR